jgi:hypothetical protein
MEISNLAFQPDSPAGQAGRGLKPNIVAKVSGFFGKNHGAQARQLNGAFHDLQGRALRLAIAYQMPTSTIRPEVVRNITG